MQLKTISFILLIMFTFVGVAPAKVSITYSSRGQQHFTMTVADDWRVNVGSEVILSQMDAEEKQPPRLISAMPNDGMPLWFAMWVPENLQKLEDAEAHMVSLGPDLLAGVKITKRKFDTLNTMEVYYVSGTGNKEGEAMDFHAAFVQLSREHVAIAIYIGPPETTKTHGEELVAMIHSLQPKTLKTKEN